MDLWPAIHDERASVLATYEGLSDEQWEVPSLCEGWTMRQLLGHLITAADPRLRPFLTEVVKARGSFDKANDKISRAEAEAPPAELIASYRSRMTNQYTPPGFGPEAPLSDIMLHGLDLRVPLGLPTERPNERWEPVLGLLLSRRARAGFVPPHRPTVRWVANDHDWSHGAGDEVTGTMRDLALTASGRGARVDALSGPGQPAVARWLSR